ncbi:MAG: peptidylprolyl isomerase [Candidatus Aminicenantes bacterium]|nr:peptidylprolyl isomerase [Candidatus Aminicenantes bacterium]
MFCLIPLSACGSGGKGEAVEAPASGPELRNGGTASPRAAGRTASGEIVLRVAEAVFTQADFERYILDATGRLPSRFEAETLSRLFDHFVEEKLLLRAAADEGVSLTPEEQKASLARALADRQLAPGRKDEAPGGGQSFLERALIEKYTALLMKGVQVGDADVAAYYEERKKDYLEPARVQVSQILLPSEERAVAVLNRIKSSTEEAFRTAARQESVGLEAAKGGAMGTFKPGQLPYEMEKVVFALSEGEVSRVVESAYGFHIFRLDRRFEPELLTVEKAAPAIRSLLLTERGRTMLAERLDTLRDRLDCQAFPEKLSFAYQRNHL